MKKLIMVLTVSLVLTGCVNLTSTVDYGETIEYTKSEEKYINEEMKKVIEDINKLTEKHKKDIDELDYEYLYIDVDNINSGMLDDIVYENNDFYGEDYFNNLVEILDTSVAAGLKDYVNEMKNKDLGTNESNENIVEEEGRTLVYSEKIGRAVVYVSDRGEDKNHISIKIDFFDVENQYYRKVFDEISDDKYILEDVISGEDLDLLDFTNIINLYNAYDSKKVKIRYNMFFAEESIEKVNILLEGDSGIELKYDDIEVFENLLNKLDLKEEEKELLIKEYREIFKSKLNKKEVEFDKYDLYINYKKGNTYSGKSEEYRYFSIAKK